MHFNSNNPKSFHLNILHYNCTYVTTRDKAKIVRLRFHHPEYSECHFPLSDFLYSPEVIIILDDGVSDLNAVHAPVPEGLIIIIGWYILR